MTTKIAEETVELDRPFGEFFRVLTSPWPFRPFLALTPGKHFIPTADVFAVNGDMVVKIDLPGMDPKDIHVKYQEGELTVSGERKADAEIKEEGYFRQESTYGFFERHIALPSGIKETDVKAQYDNGVLEISMPKIARTDGRPKVKEIPVKKLTEPLKV